MQLTARKITTFKCVDSAVEKYLTESPTKIAICGTTKCFDDYMEVARLLTFKGWSVLSVGSFGHSFHKEVSNQLPQEKIKALHFWKIEQSDAICVVNPNFHLGHSTKKEMIFAETRNKSIIEFHGDAPCGGYFKSVSLKPKKLVSFDDFLASDVWGEYLENHPDYC